MRVANSVFAITGLTVMIAAAFSGRLVGKPDLGVAIVTVPVRVDEERRVLSSVLERHLENVEVLHGKVRNVSVVPLNNDSMIVVVVFEKYNQP
jgi:hypothetical protein